MHEEKQALLWPLNKYQREILVLRRDHKDTAVSLYVST